MWKTKVWITLFLYVPYLYYNVMTDKLTFDITEMDPDRKRVEVYYEVGEIKESLGVLYFERAKKSFSRKPIGLNEWACVDAKIEGLYTKDEKITPKDIVDHCQVLIKGGA